MKKQLILGLAIAGAAFPVYAAGDGDMELMRQQLDALKQQVQQLEQRLEQNEEQQQTADTDTEASGTTVNVETGAGQPRGKELDRATVKKIAGKTYDEKQSKEVQVGGALRYNYTYTNYSDDTFGRNKNSEERGGDINLDVFRINLDADIDNLLLSAEYRFYDYMRTIHHGWVGYRFADDSQVEVGVTQVPFGLLPYASNNFYFSSNFYTGFEDDYDAGVKYKGSRGAFDYAVAFFKNDEKGGDSGSDRYSIDPTNLPAADPQDRTGAGDQIQETNTGNMRLAYTFGDGTDYSTEVGVSGQYGQIYNNTQNTPYGHNEAYALHALGNYGQFELMLQATRYEYDLDGDETAIGAAAYAFNYPFASEADSYIANLSYTVPLDIGPFDSIEFYNDYSYVGNKSGDFNNTWQNVTGAAVAAGNLYTYFDIINGKNEPFVNGIMTGNADETETLFNINMGYYF